MAKSKLSKKIDAWYRRNDGMHMCECGCRSVIEVKRSHYRTGVPKFVKGHNFQGPYNPQSSEEVPVVPTFWEDLPEDEKQRRLSKLKTFPKGDKHPNWGGGHYISHSGYNQILMPDHPFSNDGYFPEHRLTVEKWMRENAPDHEFMVTVNGEAFLNKSCIIHHRDECKTNNSLTNLVLMKNQNTHLSWHMNTGPEKDKFVKYRDSIFCPWIDLDGF